MTAITVLDQVLSNQSRQIPLATVSDDYSDRNGDIVVDVFPDSPDVRKFTITPGEARELAQALLIVADGEPATA